MKIVTDCAADMPASEMQALGIFQAPLLIQFPEGEVNSADIQADDFYDRLEAMRPVIPTTAQPSSGVFADRMKHRKLLAAVAPARRDQREPLRLTGGGNRSMHDMLGSQRLRVPQVDMRARRGGSH